MVIRTNQSGLNAWRNTKNIGQEQRRSVARLSDGNRVGSAADDAAGLAISENMKAQIFGLNQAHRNVQDGHALLQTMDGGLDGIANILIRKRELAIQALNDTYTSRQKRMIQEEVCQLIREIDALANRVEYNSMPLLNWGHGVLRAGGIGSSGGNLPSFILGPGAPGVTITSITETPAPPPLYGASVFATITPGFGTDNFATLNIPQGILAGFIMTHVGAGLNEDNLNQVSVVAPDGTIIGFHPGSIVALGSVPTIFSVNTPSATIEIHSLPASNEVNRGGVMFRMTNITEHGAGEWKIMVNNLSPVAESNSFMFLIVVEPDTTFIPPETFVLPPYQRPTIWIQAGANSGQGVSLSLFDARAAALGVDSVNVSTHASANFALIAIDNAIAQVNSYRAIIGASMNRLEFIGRSLLISSENLSDSMSRIKDTDIAKEMMNFTKSKILQEVGVSMLAQAKQTAETFLHLMR
jgi:flagellin